MQVLYDSLRFKYSALLDDYTARDGSVQVSPSGRDMADFMHDNKLLAQLLVLCMNASCLVRSGGLEPVTELFSSTTWQHASLPQVQH